MNDAIYYSKKLDNLVDRIKKEVPEPNKSRILTFRQACIGEGLSSHRIASLLFRMHSASTLMGHKEFDTFSRNEIADLLTKINAIGTKRRGYRVINEPLSKATINDYKMCIRKFWKWLKGTDDYPSEVSWVRIRGRKRNGLLPEDIWTPEEVKKLADSCNELRDKVFIMCLYDSGCRIGEFLKLRRKDVTFDENGAVLSVNGKTGSRRVRIFPSTSLLSQWLGLLPERSPTARIWVNIGRGNGKPMSHESAYQMLKRARKKSGINKRCNPHIFRHSRATNYAPKLTDAVMKEHFGWTQDSSMAGTYIHLSGKNVDDAILGMYGKKKVENGVDILKEIACPRCGKDNSPISKFCGGCGFALNEKSARENLQRREKAEQVMNLAMRHPELMEALERVLEKENV